MTETKTWKNERAWCECVRVDAYVQYPVPSPAPILSSRGLDTARMPHSVSNEGTGLERFLLSCRDFSTRYKATDVTDLDTTDITVGPVKDKDAPTSHGCSRPAKSNCSTSKTFFFFLFGQTKCMLLQKF